MFFHGNYQVTRHICPRNCYDACPILAYTCGGKIEYITGETVDGAPVRLCSKREDILATVYHPRRILYPQKQHGRGSGNWQRISWEEAIDTIARKMLSLKERYNSTLPLCLNKYSGNFGLLHFAVEGMFNGLGATTQTIGSPCFSSGIDAQNLDFGANITCDIRQLRESRLIILWGANPAWTSIHTMPVIYAAQERGAKVVVIDPVYTETARKADYYFELRPGSDAVCRDRRRADGKGGAEAGLLGLGILAAPVLHLTGIGKASRLRRRTGQPDFRIVSADALPQARRAVIGLIDLNAHVGIAGAEHPDLQIGSHGTAGSERGNSHQGAHQDHYQQQGKRGSGKRSFHGFVLLCVIFPQSGAANVISPHVYTVLVLVYHTFPKNAIPPSRGISYFSPELIRK